MSMTITDYTHQDGTQVRVRRSTRRRAGASYVWIDGVLQITIPSTASRRQEAHLTELALQKSRQRSARTQKTDESLHQRALQLSTDWLEARAQPSSVRWVGNQTTRWGSATPSESSIRLSTRLQGMPDWVIDGVLIHELCHLIAPGDGHGPTFTSWLRRYPHQERAQAFLDGVDWARHSAPVTPTAPRS